MARRMGLKDGWALDLTLDDEDGMPWDFSNVAKREKAKKMIREDRPFMVIVCLRTILQAERVIQLSETRHR